MSKNAYLSVLEKVEKLILHPGPDPDQSENLQ